MHSCKIQALRWFCPALLCSAFLVLSPGIEAAPKDPAFPHSAIPDADASKRGDRLPRSVPDIDTDRKQILTDLYDRLRTAEDEPTAALVTKAIEKLWLRSGSPTVDLLMNRVGLLMAADDFDGAPKLLNSIIEIAPAYAEGWSRRAALFFVKKDFARSLEDLRHALAIDPKHFKAIQGLGFLMQELGDNKAALKAFRHALDVHPHLEDLRQSERELSREVEGQGI